MVLPTDYPALETLVKNVVKEKQKFERLVMTKEQLLEMFAVRLIFPSVQILLGAKLGTTRERLLERHC